jgi:hypothetical protein
MHIHVTHNNKYGLPARLRLMALFRPVPQERTDIVIEMCAGQQFGDGVVRWISLLVIQVQFWEVIQDLACLKG